VIDQNLRPRQVTIHMLGGLTLVMGAVAAMTGLGLRLRGVGRMELPVALRKLLWCTFGLVSCQILLGTQMRERVDMLVAAGGCCGASLEDDLGAVYWAHRLLAALVVFATGACFFWLRAQPGRPLSGLTRCLGLLVGLSYGVGVLLVRLHLPAALQPAHLVLGTLLLGTLVAMLMLSRVREFA
jgi:cytochrome c oxidase assembly protein subunit 15